MACPRSERGGANQEVGYRLQLTLQVREFALYRLCSLTVSDNSFDDRLHPKSLQIKCAPVPRSLLANPDGASRHSVRSYRLSTFLPLLKNEWVEMGDPAPPHRRTHGGTGAGVLALVKPLPPKAVAGRPGFTRAKRPRL